MRVLLLVLIAFALFSSCLASGAINSNGACSTSYNGVGTTNVSCAVSFASGSAGTGFSRTATKIRTINGGHTYFTFNGTWSNTCPLCQNSYGCGPMSVSCWYVVWTNPTPPRRLVNGCSGAANVNLFPSGAVSTILPYVVNLPTNSDIEIWTDIRPVVGQACNANWAGVQLEVSHPPQRDLEKEYNAVRIDVDW